MPKTPLPVKDVYYVVFLLVIAILGLIFDPMFGAVYSIFIILTYVLEKSQNFVSLPLHNPILGLYPYLEALIVTGATFLLSMSLITWLDPVSVTQAGGSAQAVLSVLAAQVPPFAHNIFLAFISIVFIVPPVENTLFFGRMLEWFSAWASHLTHRQITPQTLSWGVVAVCAWVLIIWMVFHIFALQQRGIALLMAGLFTIPMFYLTLRFKSLGPGIVGHMAWNFAIFVRVAGGTP